LEQFTGFVVRQVARWQELGTTEPFLSSDELQAQLISLYSKVLLYAGHFLRESQPPLSRNPPWKQRVTDLFEDVKQLSVALEWTADTIRTRTEVFAAAGFPEETIRLRGVDELVILVINTLVPEDSTKTSRAYISEIYAQYLATLVPLIIPRDLAASLTDAAI
jgi:hypothetical protein